MKKINLPLILSIIMIAVGFFNALALSDRVRMVDILLLFFTGFGAGAGMVKTVLDVRASRRLSIQNLDSSIKDTQKPSADNSI